MDDYKSSENSPAPSSDDKDVIALLKDLSQRITYLEKKINILIKGNPERSAHKQRFSRPRGPRDNFRHGEKFHDSNRNNFDRPRDSYRKGPERKKSFDSFRDDKKPSEPNHKKRSFRRKKKRF